MGRAFFLTRIDSPPYWENEELCAMSQSTTEEATLDQKEPPCEDEEGGESGDVDVEVKEDYKEKYYYLAAEMENMRKRFSRERDNFIKYGNEKVLTGLIEVVDNLDRTIGSLAEDGDEKVKNIVVGIEMVRKQFLGVLKQNGLETVETEGKIFDPNYHEAIGQQECEDKENDEIVSVYQKGYVLKGRLLRAAKVIIAKKNENKS